MKQPETDAELRDHVAAIADAVRRSGKKHVLIFVHGGLNSVNGALDRSARLVPTIMDAGYYPVFINWHSGFWSCYGEHLFRLRQGETVPWWQGLSTAPCYLLADIGRAVTRAPVTWYYQARNDWATLYHYHAPRLVGGQRSYRRASQATALPCMSRGADERRTPNMSLVFTSWAVTSPFKYALVPFVDALGRSAWDAMSRRTETVFRKPSESRRPGPASDVFVAKREFGARAGGAVSRLTDELEGLFGPGTDYRVTVVGHSMGAMILNEIIRTHPEWPYADVVYMAPACSVREFVSSVTPALKQTGAQFYNLALHPLAEKREMNLWPGLELVPRGSLLEWIDNYYTTPLTVYDRTLGKWENITAATEIIDRSLAGQVHIKAFGVGSASALSKEFPEGNPQRHGDFDDMPFWDPALWEPKPSDTTAQACTDGSMPDRRTQQSWR